MKITINHVRKAGHCSKGARSWFERHDLDFKEFIRNGMNEEVLIVKGDALILRVIELAHEEVE